MTGRLLGHGPGEKAEGKRDDKNGRPLWDDREPPTVLPAETQHGGMTIGYERCCVNANCSSRGRSMPPPPIGSQDLNLRVRRSTPHSTMIFPRSIPI